MKFKIVPLEQGRLKEQRLIKGTKTAAHRLREGASGQRIVLAIVSSRVWILLSFKQGTKLSVEIVGFKSVYRNLLPMGQPGIFFAIINITSE